MHNLLIINYNIIIFTAQIDKFVYTKIMLALRLDILSKIWDSVYFALLPEWMAHSLKSAASLSWL